MSESFHDPEKNYIGVGRSSIPGDASYEDWVEFGKSRGWSLVPQPEYLRQLLDERAEGAVILDNCDYALAGYAMRINLEPLAVYSYDRLIDVFIDQGMSDDEAIEYVDFNVAGLWAGERTPLILYTV